MSLLGQNGRPLENVVNSGSSGSSQWTTIGSDIYYVSGNTVIGKSATGLAKIDIFDVNPNTPLFALDRISDSTIKAFWLSVNADEDTVVNTGASRMIFKTNWNGASPLTNMVLSYDGKISINTPETDGLSAPMTLSSKDNFGISLRNNSMVDRFSFFVGDGTNGFISDENYILNYNTDLHFINNTAPLSETVIIKNDGKVGIGTISPIGKLSVSSTTTADGVSIDGSSFPATALYSSGNFKGYAPFVCTAAGGFFSNSNLGDLGFYAGDSNDIIMGRGPSTAAVFMVGVNVRINTGNDNMISSASFQVGGIDKGSIPFPIMTEAQRLAISSPATGLHVYQLDNIEGVYVNKSTGWGLVY